MDAGYSVSRIRAAIRSGAVQRIRAKWIALPGAPVDLLAAADAGGFLTCVSLARRRGWWVPPDAGDGLHLHLPPHGPNRTEDATLHWSKPLAPVRPRTLEASVEDALADAARCLPLDQAVALWESAARIEQLSVDSLRHVQWRDGASRRCADRLRPGTDSSLETIFRVRLSGWGMRLRSQVLLAGHHVDFLIGSHLVVQIDGYGHHSSSADRTRDLAHDAELRLRGFTVLRFSYAQIIYGWPEVERILASAIARGLHLAPAA